MMIHARQMKAARALLDWSQKDLAEAARLSPNTIRNIETGEMSPRSATAKIIQQIFEQSGIEFTEGEGVRLRNDSVKIFQGLDGCEIFFEDVLQSVRGSNSEVLGVFKSGSMFIDVCGLKLGKFGPLQSIKQHVPVKCIMVPESNQTLPGLPCDVRNVMKQHIGPVSYFVFGDKYAIVLDDMRARYRFVVFRSTGLAEDYRQHFLSLWQIALPHIIKE